MCLHLTAQIGSEITGIKTEKIKVKKATGRSCLALKEYKISQTEAKALNHNICSVLKSINDLTKTQSWCKNKK